MTDEEGPKRSGGAVERLRKRIGPALNLAGQLLDSVEQAVIATDPEGIIIYWNRYAQKMLGYDGPQHALGTDLRTYVMAADRRAMAGAEEVVRAGRNWMGDLRWIARNGGVCHARLSLSALQDVDGEFFGLVAVLFEAPTGEAGEAAGGPFPAGRMMRGQAACEVIRGADGRAEDARFLKVNPSFERLVGMAPGSLAGRRVRETLADIDPDWIEKCARVAETDEPIQFELFSRSLERHFAVIAYSPENGRFAILMDDITDRQRTERHQRLTLQVLRILNQPGGRADLIRGILETIRAATGFDAAGIRLRAGDDYPYFYANGFSEGFLAAEGSLLTPDAEGRPICEPDGAASLACMCGAVLRERIDIGRPFFTEGGSFWTNSTTDMLADPEGFPKPARAMCSIAGYESVALIPLRRGKAIIGLLQLNDRRRNRLDPALIHFLEDLGAVIGIAVARKRDEENIRESESRFRQLARHIEEVFWIWDLTGDGLLYVSPGYERIWGRPPPDGGRMLFLAGLDPADAPALAPFLAQFEDTGRFSAEYRIMRADGGRRWIACRTYPINDESGRMYRVAGIIRDISDRKEAEERAQWMAAIVASSRDAIIGKSLAGQIRIWNRGAARIFGYSSGEMTGRPAARLFPPEGVAVLEEILAAVARGETVAQTEVKARHKSGAALWIDVTVSPVMGAGGGIIGAATIARDITEQKRIEKQMRQARKMEAIGTLAGGIAHDFNNILFPVIGYAEMTQDLVPPDGQAAGNLEKILTAARRARDLVAQILSFSRRGEEVRRPMALSPVLKETLKLMSASLPSTIRIEKSIAEDVGHVLADATQMQQVIINLCTNAYHAMRETGGLLRVSLADATLTEAELAAAEVPEAGRYVTLTVSDTGCGMTPDVIEQIYEPYFTTKPHGQGTGMGLFMVYGIVKEHGGHMTVESRIGEGTTFAIYLPRLDPTALSNEIDEDGAPETGSERLLIVDDEEVVLLMLRKMLEGLGYAVTAVTSSLAALEIFREDPMAFDGVITDMTMPHMTGLDLSRRITALRPGLPVILHTGYSDLVSREKLRAAGIRDLLMKPVGRRELATRMRGMFRKADAGTANAVATNAGTGNALTGNAGTAADRRPAPSDSSSQK